MKTAYRDFCIKYRDKLKYDKEPDTTLRFNNTIITFTLNYKISLPGTITHYMYGDSSFLFNLDSEDLEYLYKKYSKKVIEEMNDNINEIKKSYKDFK